ncbi:MAG: C-GCAxxG-C-C family protein [Christensenellales bacterium]
MLKKKIENNFGKYQTYTNEEKEKYGDKNYNCCEKILRGGNQVYDLGLDSNAEHVSAPFGLGMGINTVCGALCGALMVFGARYCDSIEKQSNVKEISINFLQRFEKEMGSIYCRDLRPKYYVDDPMIGCDAVVLKVAEMLDETIENDPTCNDKK